MALGARFQTEGGGGLNSQGLAPMFFWKHVISLVALLLIIHVMMYILISLI